MGSEPLERLQKVLASAGIASRRKAEELIQQGRVTVNGQVITQLGTKVDPIHDDIRVDGQRLRTAAGHTYILLNKPRGYLSSMEDPQGRKSLGDLVQLPVRLYPVGRLDVTSEGLILLTDDGELAHLLTHPRYQHTKEYRVLVQGHPSDKTLEAWRHGVILEGRPTAPAQVEVLRSHKDTTLLRIVLREGRKRQIRRVAALLGHPVLELKRVRMGPLQLGNLEPGKWRRLTPQEVQSLESLKQLAQQSRKPRRGRRAGSKGESITSKTQRRKAP